MTLDSEWVDDTAFPSNCVLPWTETQFDAIGRPAVTVLPDGSELSNSFVGDSAVTVSRNIAIGIDEFGNAGTTELDRMSFTDALGRLRRLKEEVTTGDFYQTDYDYDQADRLTKVALFSEGANPTTSQDRVFSYHGSGFLSATNEPERAMDFPGYDALGNNTEQTRILSGVTHTHDFDGFGRYSWTKEDNVLLTEQSWGTAAVGEPSYNQIIETVRHNWFGAADVAVTHNWLFDAHGGRISERTTSISGLGELGDEFDLAYEYDEWGNRSNVRFPRWNGCRNSEIPEVTTTWDGSWAESLEVPGLEGQSVPICQATYHPSGRISTLSYGDQGNPVVWNELEDPDGMPRPSNITLTLTGGAGDPALIPLGTTGVFSYDSAGNIWQKGDKRYIYDGLSRLTDYSTFDSGGGGLRGLESLQEFEYDRWGNTENIKSYDEFGALESQLTFAMAKSAGIPTTNRIDTVNDSLSKATVTLGWDGRGNLTTQPAVGALRQKSYDWSEDDRLMESTDSIGGASAAWRYAYDAAGERVLKWHDAGSGVEATVSIRDEGGMTISEWRNVAGTDYFDVIKDYLNLGARQVGEIDHTGTLDDIQFIATDHLGSPTVIFDRYGDMVDSMTFEPFGALEESSSTPATSHLFTGHERDLGEYSSELDYMHQRYYSPGLARFVSVDPVLGAMDSSQSWNRYSYVLNNPISLVDPNGESAEAVVGVVVTGVKAGGTSAAVGTAAVAGAGVAASGGLGWLIGRTAGQFEVSGTGMTFDQIVEDAWANALLKEDTSEAGANEAGTGDSEGAEAEKRPREGAGKNEQHGRSENKPSQEQQLKDLEQQLKDATGRREKVKLKNKIKRTKRDMDRQRAGEQHSQRHKGN